MKILFLVKSSQSASTRYRVLQFLPFLEKNGIEPIVREAPRDLGGWVRLLRAHGAVDLVFVQRKRLPFYVVRVLQYLRKPIVYDIDDAVMFRDSHSGSPHSLKRAIQFRRMARASRLVIAGNSFLKEQSERYARKVEILPTSIDPDRYRQKENPSTSDVAIGWIGERKTLPYLAARRDVWEALGQKYGGRVSLTIISNEFITGDHIRILPKAWSYEREIEDLMTIDIGVMPLVDDLWSRGKCGFKILQYLGVGVPVVCSPVGANRDIVNDGVHGFWAEDSEEWVRKLSLLIEDPELRVKMGREGRRKVLESYSLEKTAPILLSLLEEIHGYSSKVDLG